MAHRVARQLKGRAPDVPSALSPELFDLLCEMRLQLAAQQKQHAQLRQEMSAEVASLWRAVLSGQAGTGKLASGAAALHAMAVLSCVIVTSVSGMPK